MDFDKFSSKMEDLENRAKEVQGENYHEHIVVDRDASVYVINKEIIYKSFGYTKDKHRYDKFFKIKKYDNGLY